MLASLALLGLGIFGPGIATGLVSGAPQLGAGAAAGTALGAAGLAVAGGAALAGGARLARQRRRVQHYAPPPRLPAARARPTPKAKPHPARPACARPRPGSANVARSGLDGLARRGVGAQQCRWLLSSPDAAATSVGPGSGERDATRGSSARVGAAPASPATADARRIDRRARAALLRSRRRWGQPTAGSGRRELTYVLSPPAAALLGIAPYRSRPTRPPPRPGTSASAVRACRRATGA